jgi:hypothetical protein
MPHCEHKYIQYLGDQETTVEGEHLKLYNCLTCHTTIAYCDDTTPEIIAAAAS